MTFRVTLRTSLNGSAINRPKFSVTRWWMDESNGKPCVNNDGATHGYTLHIFYSADKSFFLFFFSPFRSVLLGFCTSILPWSWWYQCSMQHERRYVGVAPFSTLPPSLCITCGVGSQGFLRPSAFARWNLTPANTVNNQLIRSHGDHAPAEVGVQTDTHTHTKHCTPTHFHTYGHIRSPDSLFKGKALDTHIVFFIFIVRCRTMP